MTAYLPRLASVPVIVLLAISTVSCASLARAIVAQDFGNPAYGGSERLLLFSSDNDFHGCLNCSRYDSDSICNQYGTYGNRYDSKSIWNSYGIGSIYNSKSPFNQYGQGLKIVDEAGAFYGYLKIGYGGATQYSTVLKELYEEFNDHSKVRDAFCD